jgi:hypothetical protein
MTAAAPIPTMLTAARHFSGNSYSHPKERNGKEWKNIVNSHNMLPNANCSVSTPYIKGIGWCLPVNKELPSINKQTT